MSEHTTDTERLEDDAEALASELIGEPLGCATSFDLADMVVASDWMRDHDARVRAAALAPIQALADEWDRELRSTFKDPDSEVARGYTHKHSDAVRTALAAAGVDTAHTETTTEVCTGAGTCNAPTHVHGCFADRDGSRCDDPADHPRAAVPSGHEQDGDHR